MLVPKLSSNALALLKRLLSFIFYQMKNRKNLCFFQSSIPVDLWNQLLSDFFLRMRARGGGGSLRRERQGIGEMAGPGRTQEPHHDLPCGARTQALGPSAAAFVGH